LSRINPSSLEWALLSNTQTFTSPLNQSVQSLEMPGARWRFSCSFDSLSEADAAAMRTFLAQLRGRSNRFTVWPLGVKAVRGVATGTPLVNGAAQTGTTLATDGWTPSTAGILLAGDYIGVNGELKLLVADAASNGAGEATLSFEPPLRASPVDNAVITTTRPLATFMLDEDASRWTTAAPSLDSFSIAATEAF
jgi:hypothetical protein